MECIDGQPLDAWLADAKPERVVRIALFLAICSAVGFAHQNLIIHRDITPSNILVADDGTPKLIDFGIARPPVAGDEAPSSSRKSLAGLSLTPGFAAPERLAGDPATTLSDVYSLGVLLDRLLTGDADADVSAIVRQATATDPGDRYPSVDALADDVRAWRDGHVVGARQGGRRYAAAKFVARHRAGVGAATATLIVLVGAFIVTLQAYSRAEAARSAEKARFEEVRSLASYMMFDLNNRLARVVGNADARASLADRAQRYLSALAASPGTSDELKLEAARGFIALARVQGVPTQANLGKIDQARANLRKAVDMLGADDVPKASAVPVRVEARALSALIEAHSDADTQAADRTLALADADLRSVDGGARGTAWLAARSRLRRSQLELTVLGNQPDRMIRLARTIDAEVSDWPAAMQTLHEAAFDRAVAMHYRGLHGYFTGQLAPGVDALIEAERRLTALDRARPNDPATLYLLAFNAYVGFGTADGLPNRKADAARFLATARQSVDRLLLIEPNDRALQAFAGSVLGAEAQALGTQGRFAQALATQRQVVALYEKALGAERKPIAMNRLAIAHVTMGNIAIQSGSRRVACESTDTALALVTELKRRAGALGSVARFEGGLAANANACGHSAPDSPLRVLA